MSHSTCTVASLKSMSLFQRHHLSHLFQTLDRSQRTSQTAATVLNLLEGCTVTGTFSIGLFFMIPVQGREINALSCEANAPIVRSCLGVLVKEHAAGESATFENPSQLAELFGSLVQGPLSILHFNPLHFFHLAPSHGPATFSLMYLFSLLLSFNL